MKVGILGGGQWGQALAHLVIAAGNEPLIAYRDKKPSKELPSTDSPPIVGEQCELIIVAVSAGKTKGAIELAKLGPQHRVVVAGRGIDPTTSHWLTDVVESCCEARRFGALAGPAPAEEILNGSLCAAVVASPFDEVRALTTAALHSSRYRVYESRDLIGVQLASAAVPVLATLLGVAQSLRGTGVGLHGLVLARGLEEMGRLARALGADPITLTGLAGAGDLVAAQGRKGHPNFDAGTRLAKGKIKGGPLGTAQALANLAERHNVELPLVSGLLAIYAGTPALDAVTALMSRKAQPEFR